MDSHSDNKAQDSTVPSAGGGFPATVEWSEEYGCEVVNGVLSPFPLSSRPIEINEPKQKSKGSGSRKRQPGSPSKAKEGEESQLPQGGSSKKKRKTEGNEELFFKLFKISNVEGKEYVLEMHMVNSSDVSRSHLKAKVEWKLGVSDFAEGNHMLVPVVEDPHILNIPEKQQFSLQERLVGWTLEIRKRPNGKEDKFYYHRNRQFRSFVEVAKFILYSCKLKQVKTKSQEVRVEEQSTTIMPSSSSYAGKNLTTLEPAPINIELKSKSIEEEVEESVATIVSSSSHNNEKENSTVVETMTTIISSSSLPKQENSTDIPISEPNNEKSEHLDGGREAATTNDGDNNPETTQFLDPVNDIFSDCEPLDVKLIFD